MSEEKRASSQPEQTGDVTSGNLSVSEATQRLLAASLPKEEGKPKEETTVATENAPVETEQVAPGSTTEPPAESEETAEVVDEVEAPQEESGDVLSHDTELTPEEREKFKAVQAKWQEGVNKRIGKEKQKRLDAEERAKELEAQLQQAMGEKPEPVVVAAPSADNPLADVNDVQSLAGKEKAANEAVYQAQAILDLLEEQGAAEYKVGETTYTRQMLREIRREAERQLREFIPARHRFLIQQAEFKNLVKRDIPEMLDPKSPMFKEAQQARMLYPQLAGLPNGDYLIGLALRGARSLAAEQAAKTQKKAPVTTQKPPLSQTATTAAVTSQTRAKPNAIAAYEAEKKKVFAKGNVTAAEAAGLLLKRETLSTFR